MVEWYDRGLGCWRKEGVQVANSPLVLWMAENVKNAYNEIGKVCVITSGTDGKHKKGSYHYVDAALDFRTRHLTDDEIKRVYDKAKQYLGRRYDIVVEETHMHVECDLRRWLSETVQDE